MTIAAKLTMDKQQLTRLLNKTKKLPNNVGDSLFTYAQFTANNMKKNVLIDPLRQPTKDRVVAAQLIKAKKLNKNRSVIKMPQSLVFLDSMKPHYVPLKHGSSARKWANKYFGTTKVGGGSRVIRNFAGKIAYSKGSKSAMYVMPHPFVQRTLHNARKIFPDIVRKGIVKTYKGTAS